MRYTFAILLIIVFAVINIPTALAEAPDHNIEILRVLDNANDCGLTQHNGAMILGLAFRFRMTGENFIGHPLEMFFLLVRDANGNIIGNIQDPFGPQGFSDYGINPQHTNHDFIVRPTSRPWTFETVYFSNPNGLASITTEQILETPPAKTFTFDPALYVPSCASLPYINNGIEVNPVNEGIAVNDVSIFNATDDNGEPALHIYDINDDGEGTLVLEITQDIIAPYVDNAPSENTELMTSENGKVTLYILDTGELQINSGPDEQGKTHVLIFDGIPPTNVYGYVIDLPLFP